MNNLYNSFYNWCQQNNWALIENKQGLVSLHSSVSERYQNIPVQYRVFLAKFKSIVSPDQTTWFLCEDDYNGTSETAFCWNEFEKLSLDAATGDNAWEKEITMWWDNNFPIILSVRGSYSFYAIDMSSHAIVKGTEPEFEEARKIASNFEEFLQLVIAGTIEL